MLSSLLCEVNKQGGERRGITQLCGEETLKVPDSQPFIFGLPKGNLGSALFPGSFPVKSLTIREMHSDQPDWAVVCFAPLLTV